MTTGPDGGEQTFADVLNGLTFGGGGGRGRGRRTRFGRDGGGRGHGADRHAAPTGSTAYSAFTAFGADIAATTGAEVAADPGADAGVEAVGWPTETEAAEPVQPEFGRAGVGVDAGTDADTDTDTDDAAIVRPYAWTRGRTRSSLDLQVETLVSARSVPAGPLEHRSIAELCQIPHSVAEIAALLDVPLGVAKVLVSDMAEAGHVTVHRTASSDGSEAHFVLMERVLSGLRRL